ncbi:MAG: type IV toxin-antitoxin system AbiEi family antitoxin domain-containing protein [Armatimonadota bacterium]
MLSRLETGYYTFSLNEAETAVGAGRKTWDAVDRLVKQGWLFSPSKGFYIIIDPQHQGSGFLPVEWFIEDWMKHLGGQYYLGLLTAAMLHGASHQKPQVIQVVRDRVFTDVNKAPYHISFFFKKTISDVCFEQRQSPAGYFMISSPEMTAYDILRYPKACPSLSLAATVLQELGEKINADRLAALVDSGAEVATLQRLGWLLDYTGWSEVTGSLAARLQGKKMAWRQMRTDLPKVGARDQRWRVVVNDEIEADL